MRVIMILLIGLSLSNCALLAGGIVGGVVADSVIQHQQWCNAQGIPLAQCR